MNGKPDRSGVDVHALARGLFGSHSVDIANVRTEGMETYAYRVTSGGRTACLRIGRSTRGFAKDAWAFEALGSQLPIPRVLELGELDNEHAFCLSQWMPGTTLQDITAREVERVLPAVFGAWEIIASRDIADLAGFGDFDPDNGVAPYDSWRALLYSQAEQVASWDNTWTVSRTEQLTEVLTAYEALVDRCPDGRQLVHGDWGSNNLLVADGRVTGVLDWEAASIGDPLQDVGGRFWATWPPVTTCVTLQSAYCDRLLGATPNFRERVLCYDLRTGLAEIDAALREGDHEFADWALDRSLSLVRADGSCSE